MLDADCAFKQIKDADVWIYWGAYIGTKDEILMSGRLLEVSDAIQRRRGEARARKGWIMDIYLLRRQDRP
jgi:precorrin-6A synthase